MNFTNKVKKVRNKICTLTSGDVSRSENSASLVKTWTFSAYDEVDFFEIVDAIVVSDTTEVTTPLSSSRLPNWVLQHKIGRNFQQQKIVQTQVEFKHLEGREEEEYNKMS